MLKSNLILVAMLLVIAGGAYAQSNERVSVFGGYSYQRLNSSAGDGANLNGWIANAQLPVKRSFALAGEVAGGYGSQTGADLKLHTFLVGPRMIHRRERADFFAHALVGGAHLNASAHGIGDAASAFATQLGGGLDLRLTPHTSLRVFQADYLWTRFGGNTQNNFRLAAGVVFRLGTRKSATF